MPKTQRTIVYIDGYNFYYGRLKGTPYKWLDIVKLFESCIINPQLPESELVLIKYFTANVKANFSTHGDQGVEMQNRYHRALQELYPNKLEIIYGFHTAEEVEMPKYLGKGRVDKTNSHKVWRLNEKQTDVNIALHLYRDAIHNKAENLVVCSSDSDLVPALRIIKNDVPEVNIGLVLPRKPRSEDSNNRPPNKDLSNLANWTRSHINNEELAICLLPNSVSTSRKAIKKPDYW